MSKVTEPSGCFSCRRAHLRAKVRLLMRMNKVCQTLKSFADDTRLRIINLLNKQQLNVTELCQVLRLNQSNISKHLRRLRLTGVVGNKREGLNVYYYLIKPARKSHRRLLNAIIVDLAELQIFKQDLVKLKKFRQRSTKIKPSLKRDRKR